MTRHGQRPTPEARSTPARSAGRASTLLAPLALTVACLVGLTGCNEMRQLEFGIPAGERPHHEFNLRNMWDSPAVEAQELGMRLPAPAAINQDSAPYPSAAVANPELSATLLGNPVAMNETNLKRGQDLYGIYCVACHGERGLGNGSIIDPKKFSVRPPSLTSRKLREYKDGQIYHIITNGQNNMGHYRSQIRPMERWAIVHYVRALQRAEYPLERDLKRYEQLRAAETAAKAAAAPAAAPAATP